MKVNLAQSGLILVLCAINSLLSASDFAPSFIQAGKRYLGDIDVSESEFLVLEIGDQGWIKVDSDDKTFWINTSVMSYIIELTVEDEKAYINKRKQKETMADMRAIATSCEAYAVDNNIYPYSFSGKTSDLIHVLEPIYIKRLPIKDGWGQEFSYYTDATFQQYWIISLGADGKRESGIYGSDGIPLPVAEGAINDLDADLIFSQGSFLRLPEGIAR